MELVPAYIGIMDNFGWNRVVIIQQEENLFALVTLIARKICNNTVKNCTLMPVMNVTLRLSKIGCIAEKFGVWELYSTENPKIAV